MTRSDLVRLELLAALFVLFAEPLAANCNWKTVPASMDFGNYSVFSGGSTTAVTGLSFSCNPNTTATLTVSLGMSNVSRMMSTPAGDTIPYDLYRDAAGNATWGDGSAGSGLTFTASPQNKDFTADVFGRVYPQADAAAGVYTDSLDVTLAWETPKSGSSTVTITVQVTVIPECEARGATLGFGRYEPIGTHATAPLEGSTVLSVFCTRKATATIQLSEGAWSSGISRRMRSDANDFLAYALFSDREMASPWNSIATLSATSSSKNVPLGGGLPLYGRVPAGQDVSAGTYQDTVQALVNY